MTFSMIPAILDEHPPQDQILIMAFEHRFLKPIYYLVSPSTANLCFYSKHLIFWSPSAYVFGRALPSSQLDTKNLIPTFCHNFSFT